MDRIDRTILSELQKDSRASMAELGKKLNVAPSTVFKRIDKLRTGGMIERFTIQVNPQLVDEGMVAFLLIAIEPDERDAIAKYLEEHPNVLELYETLEPADFIAKVRVTTIARLKLDVLIPLSKIPGVREIKPAITVKRIKDEAWTVEP